MTRRTLFATFLTTVACARTPRARAAAWLWDNQSDTGGWHSQTYGLLRSGQSLTPFVLTALLSESGVNSTKVKKAIGFLRDNTRPDGSLGCADPISVDYPNYATALGVQAIIKAQQPGWQAQIAPMVHYLKLQQFTEQNGWNKTDAAYGAWGMGGERRTPPGTGHVDLSMTRHVLQALSTAGVPASDPAMQKAQVYVDRLKNPDGGFIFSTTEEDTNKAGREGEVFRSYGTATSDAILTLIATGAPVTDARIQKAWQWLETRHRPGIIPGFVGEAYQRWHQGLRFYYASALNEAATALNKRRLTVPLMEQERDGSFINSENLVKEDDPLIATTFAVKALA